MVNKRITIISGHYGSGKTNIAVNLALDTKKHTEKVIEMLNILDRELDYKYTEVVKNLHLLFQIIFPAPRDR